MIGKTTDAFLSHLSKLPGHVQQTARQKYELWTREPFHPSLHFKELMPGLWSVRAGLHHRALGRRNGDTIVWFWIGTHAEYDRLIS